VAVTARHYGRDGFESEMANDSHVAREATALAKYACPACGAEAEWTPARQALVCSYCGTVSPATLAADGGLVKEHDLAEALRAIPSDKRAWESDRVSVQCQSCKAISLFERDRVAQRCEFCGSPAIVPYKETRAPIVPESVLPFKVSEPQVRERMRAWYASRWFAPNRLKRAAMTDTLHGLYIPYWTFDAQVHARWSAEAGYYYYVNEEYRDSNGRTQVRQVQRVRWEAAAGQIDHFFDDELVNATRGLHESLLHQIEPFPTTDLRPYDPGYVSGWVVEQYQIDLVAAAARSRQQMDDKLRDYCARQVPGDTHRNLVVDADYSDQTFKHILAPVWMLTYTLGARSFQVLVNGYTGATAGEQPYSWIKITLAAIVALIVLLIVISVLNR
jgi:DNA-directed RNA polymerase subunit RPC12/RpoP